jgi:hypothetical protein
VEGRQGYTTFFFLDTFDDLCLIFASFDFGEELRIVDFISGKFLLGTSITLLSIELPTSPCSEFSWHSSVQNHFSVDFGTNIESGIDRGSLKHFWWNAI